MFEDPLSAIAAIIVLGIAAQLVAWRLRVPSILVLLSLGVIVGPALGLIDPDELFGDLLLPVVSLSAAIILFEGGLSLDLRILRGSNWVIWRLITLGVVATGAIGAVSAHLLFDVDWGVAFLLGAIVVVTGPTVIGPLLQQIRPTGRSGQILRAEGVLVDPIGALAAIVVFEVIVAGGANRAESEILSTVLRTVGGGLVLGLAAAALVVIGFARFAVPDHLHSAFGLGMALMVFAVADNVQEESGLFAVTVLGIALATQRWVPVNHVHEFSETLRVLLIAGLFIVLGARMQPGDLPSVTAGGIAFVAVLVLVARPLSVLLSTTPSRLNRAERIFLVGVAPRGIVAAAIASVFAIRLEELDVARGAELMIPITYIVIVGTIAIYGLGAGPLARRLGLADRDPQGVLIIGASAWARDLAALLTDQGLTVVMVDAERRNIAAARLRGLRTVYGSILSERILTEMDLAGIGRVFALSPSEEVNALAAQRLVPVFGRREVYHLAPASMQESDRQEIDRELRVRVLFGPEVTFGQIVARYDDGWRMQTTEVTESLDLVELREQYRDQALAMLRIDPDGRVEAFTADRRPNARPGDRIISLVSPDLEDPRKAAASPPPETRD